MTNVLTRENLIVKIIICSLLLTTIMVFCSMIGTEKLSFGKILAGAGENTENIDHKIFFGVRLPRVILAALVGAALASSGVVLQAILRNPLADPYILGISSGAGLGAIVAALSGINWTFWAGSPIAVFAFIGAISAVWLVWLIGRFTGKSQVTTLLLAGVVVNAFLSSVIMFLTSIAKSEQVYSTIFWLMGNITEKTAPVLWVSACCIGAGIVGLFTICHRLNVLTFGAEQAVSLGVDPAKIRFIGFTLTAFITAIAVSLSGLVGFAGLIVPHAVRLVFGPDHRQVLPLSAIIGAGFLVCADTFARTVVAPAQLPVGIVTAIAGGPFFLILLAKHGRKVGWLK